MCRHLIGRRLKSDKELRRLRSLPNGTATTSKLIEPCIRLLDGPSFAAQYDDIFIHECYDFPFEGDAPTIIDGGANVGTAVIWWRSRWPRARISAIEPDPSIYQVLKWNVRHHQGLDLRCAALSTDALGSTFLADGLDSGRLSLGEDEEFGAPISVATVKLSDVIRELSHVDLLKLDIEGSETEVLTEADPYLAFVDRIFVEYHSIVKRPQTLDSLLGLLTRKGFRYRVEGAEPGYRPFCSRVVDRGVDMQCNVFAWR